MRKTPLRRVSDKQKIEIARRRRVRRQLERMALRDSVGRILCTKCHGRPDWRGIQMIHMIPLSRGGKTDIENCQLWCAPCHFGPEGHRWEGVLGAEGV